MNNIYPPETVLYTKHSDSHACLQDDMVVAYSPNEINLTFNDQSV